MSKPIFNCFSFNLVGDVSIDEINKLTEFFALNKFQKIADYFYVSEFKTVVDLVVIVQDAARKFPWFKNKIEDLKYLRCTDIEDLSSIF